MITKIGVDFGAAYITLCDAACDISREHSFALIDKQTNALLALGDDTLSDNGKDGIVVSPFSKGLMEYPEITSRFIEDIVKAVSPADRIRALVALPSDMPPKAVKDFFTLFYDAGISEAFGIKRAYAAFLGAGGNPLGNAVSVNIGASSTDICVLYHGDVILANRVSAGGRDFDMAVSEYVEKQAEVSISNAVATSMKEKLGAVWPGRPSESVRIEGILSLTGNKVSMDITTEDIVGVFEKPLQKIMMAIAETVKEIPTDKITEIFETGIVLSGGGALLFGMDRMVNKVLDIPTHTVMCADTAVARGLARIHSYLPVRLRIGGKDITEKIKEYAKKIENNESEDTPL